MASVVVTRGNRKVYDSFLEQNKNLIELLRAIATTAQGFDNVGLRVSRKIEYANIKERITNYSDNIAQLYPTIDSVWRGIENLVQETMKLNIPFSQRFELIYDMVFEPVTVYITNPTNIFFHNHLIDKILKPMIACRQQEFGMSYNWQKDYTVTQKVDKHSKPIEIIRGIHPRLKMRFPPAGDLPTEYTAAKDDLFKAIDTLMKTKQGLGVEEKESRYNLRRKRRPEITKEQSSELAAERLTEQREAQRRRQRYL